MEVLAVFIYQMCLYALRAEDIPQWIIRAALSMNAYHKAPVISSEVLSGEFKLGPGYRVAHFVFIIMLDYSVLVKSPFPVQTKLQVFKTIVDPVMSYLKPEML